MVAKEENRWVLLAILLCISSAWGKTTSRPSDSIFASVKIENHSKTEIQAATIAVFKKAGYTSAGIKGELLFEADGKPWMQRAYRRNISGGDPVMERVKAQIVLQDSGALLLKCNAYAVQTMGSRKKEIAVRVRRSGPYRELLKQVARKLL